MFYRLFTINLQALYHECCSPIGYATRYRYREVEWKYPCNCTSRIIFFSSFTLIYSFPVYGWKWQEYYSAYYRYIPLVESPGVAFIIIEKEGLSPSQRLINEVFGTWPYMVITTLLAVLAGMVVWFLVNKNLLLIK